MRLDGRAPLRPVPGPAPSRLGLAYAVCRPARPLHRVPKLMLVDYQQTGMLGVKYDGTPDEAMRRGVGGPPRGAGVLRRRLCEVLQEVVQEVVSCSCSTSSLCNGSAIDLSANVKGDHPGAGVRGRQGARPRRRARCARARQEGVPRVRHGDRVSRSIIAGERGPGRARPATAA